VSHSKKFLPCSGAVVVCCLALTGAQALAQNANNKTTVRYPTGYAVSSPLRELPIDIFAMEGREMPEPRPLPMGSKGVAGPWQQDSALQTETRPMVSATPGTDFDGIPANGFAPSDSNMAVGPNHIVETVNVRLAVYSKTGTLLSGPTTFGTFFAPLGGNCANGASDPIVLYDRAADRWLISDIGYTGAAPFLECVGVSKTNDPTGAYVLYSFSFGSNLNDYPKLSTWATASNAAYLATYNIFGPGGFLGADLCGFDRTKMLAGNPAAAQLCKMTPNNDGSYLPSDMDGPTPPTDGTPGLFVTWNNNNPGELFLRKLTLNFGAGTATLSSPTSIPVANFNVACGSCVPQLGTTTTLDTLGDRPMYRFAIRHFADHDRAVFSHAVANGSQVAVRWYELFDPAGAVTVNQQGTFAPDATYRWMSSIAEDQNMNIGLGYSASSSSINPAIRFTGRVPSDPLGTMETEASQLVGTGSQTGGLSRWGDYTAMQVDPSDDCTFWYVDQYEKVSGSFNWNTNIGSFKFTGCGRGGGPAVSLSATALNFKKVPIGQTSSPQTVTLTNSGTATLNISSITTSGDYHISNNTCGATVAAGANCAVSVTFTPTKKGKRTGNLTFTDNAPTSPQVVTLTGVGQSITVSPTSLTFGTVAVGNTSSQQNVTVTNVGTTTVTFTGFVFAGTAAGDYLISANTCGATIAAGASCSVGVEFKPTTTGKRAAKLNVKNNGGGSPASTSLTGTGS
jgi:hypothetical protein